MKTTTLVVALLAVGPIFIVGCRDDRALGTEREPAPQMPPATEHRPLDEPALAATSDPMATTPSPRAPVASAENTSGTVERAPEVMSGGDDPAKIPELREPIWSTDESVDIGAQTSHPSSGLEPCPANPGGQERREAVEPTPR